MVLGVDDPQIAAFTHKGTGSFVDPDVEKFRYQAPTTETP
jgi:hypothetical protein